MRSKSLRIVTMFMLLFLLAAPASAHADRNQGLTPVSEDAKTPIISANPEHHGAAANSPALVDWSDNFDSYATDLSLHGVGGWKGWGNSPAATAYTRNTQARSAPNSVEIVNVSDLVHEYSGCTSDLWIYTAWQYIPASATGESYFILLNQYDDAGATNNWSVQVDFDSNTDVVVNEGPAGGQLPLIHDQWVEIRVEIDLDADLQRFYYGGNLLFQGSWTDGMSGGGILNIAAVDLWGNNATAVYYDDLSLIEFKPRGVTLSPATQTLIGAPDEVITYTYTLTNTGVVSDSFGLSVTGNSWPTAVISATGQLLPNEAIPVEVVVTIPTAPAVLQTPIASDTFVLTAVSLSDPNATTQAEGTTVAEVDLAVELGEDQSGSGLGGDQVNYTFTVTNTGEYTDSFTLAEAGGEWAATLSMTTTESLAPGASQAITLTVEIPPGVMAGEADTTTLIASSILDPRVSDGALATTVVEAAPGVNLGGDQAGSGAVDAQVPYVFTVTNTGNYTDTFGLTLTGGTWPATLSMTTTAALAPDTSQVVTLTVDIPVNTMVGDTDTVTITAASMLDPGVSDSAEAMTQVTGWLIYLPLAFKSE